MGYQKKSLKNFTIQELDRELIARFTLRAAREGFQFRDKEGTPAREAVMVQLKQLYENALSYSPNEALSHFDTQQLIKTIRQHPENLRGIHGKDNRMDFYKIPDEQVKKNAACIAAICMENDIIDSGEGYSTLRVKNYGKTFNLCSQEPFHYQPVAAGPMCSGFLVEKDIIATVGHFANEGNVRALRVAFGYKMINESTTVIRVSNKKIYKGMEISNRSYCRMKNGMDWALVKLDRNVLGQTIATLSKREISYGQSVYILGHPLGLPLKYAHDASVKAADESCFRSDLDVYSGNSGSPVFNSSTHEVVGIVVHGDSKDFRWTGRCWISVVYRSTVTGYPYPSLPQCIKASKFINILEKL